MSPLQKCTCHPDDCVSRSPAPCPRPGPLAHAGRPHSLGEILWGTQRPRPLPLLVTGFQAALWSGCSRWALSSWRVSFTSESLGSQNRACSGVEDVGVAGLPGVLGCPGEGARLEQLVEGWWYRMCRTLGSKMMVTRRGTGWVAGRRPGPRLPAGEKGTLILYKSLLGSWTFSSGLLGFFQNFNLSGRDT